MGLYSKSDDGTNRLLVDNGEVSTGYDGGIFKRVWLGSRSDYYRAVIPLVNVDNTRIDRFSYTSGRIEFVRNNGCCYQGNNYLDFKMQKTYSTTNFYTTVFHANTSYIRWARFTWNGNLWAGIDYYQDVQSHSAYFSGISTEDLGYYNGLPVIRYQDVRDNSVYNSEVYNSLETWGI